MISLHASVLGLQALEGQLSKLASPSLMHGVLDESLAVLLNRIRTRFLAEMAPDGVKWKPSAAGLKRRAGGYTYRNKHKYSGTGTLFETGTLFHSIQAFRPVDPDERGIMTDVPYAKYLQRGPNEGPWVFLGVGKDDLTVLEKLVTRRVQEALK